MVAYVGCIPLHLFEENIFFLMRMVRFCALRTGKHHLLCCQCFILLQLCCKKNNTISTVKQSLDDDYQLHLNFGTSVF